MDRAYISLAHIIVSSNKSNFHSIPGGSRDQPPVQELHPAQARPGAKLAGVPTASAQLGAAGEEGATGGEHTV